MSSQNWVTGLGFLLCVSVNGQYSHAKLPDCSKKQHLFFDITICENKDLKRLNQDIVDKYLVTQLMSNAPLTLLQHSQQAWEKYARLCKTMRCIRQQFEKRLDDLTLLMSLNQSFTQHFIRYRGGKHTQQMTTLQFHQMDKSRIKIEGMQYRNPNNTEAARIAYLRAYTPTLLNEPIIDLESGCKYTLKRTKYTLMFESKDKLCQRFVGHYKIYD